MRPVILLFLMVLLIAFPAVSQATNDILIVPGERIGKWTLKISIGDLQRMNGPSSERHIYAGAEPNLDLRRDLLLYGWSSLALGAGTYDGEKVEVLIAGFEAGPVSFKTDRGISLLQSKRSDILQEYGKPITVIKAASVGHFVLLYDKIGIAFKVLNPSGTIRDIYVFRPGTAKTIWKF